MNIKDIILKGQATIREAMGVINNHPARIVLVIEDETLKGTVTDGDIRRALLNGHELDTSLMLIMNQKPSTAKIGESKESLFRIMNRLGIKSLPIIDETGKIIDVVTMDRLSHAYKYDNQVILMCGGRGERLRPYTDDTPKPMLLVKDMPILEHIVIRLANQGFSNFTFSIHYLGDQIRDYFADGAKWDVNINYIEEDQPLGTAGALGLIDKAHFKDSFFLMNSDIVTDLNLHPMLENHYENDPIATIGTSFYHYQIPFGVLNDDNGRLLSIKEKPMISHQISAGIYLLSPNILDYIHKNERLDMPDLLKRAMKHQQRIDTFPIVETWYDIGHHADLKFVQEN